jgi:hypothetical protein
MLPTTIITTLALILEGSSLLGTAEAKRRCFGGHSIDMKVMKDHAIRACEGYGDGNGNHINGRFQGVFGPDESRKVCVPAGTVGHVAMEVKNLNKNQAFDLRDGDCTKELWSLVDDCTVLDGPLAYGGEDTDVYGWKFL